MNWIRHRRVRSNLAGVAFYFPPFTCSIHAVRVEIFLSFFAHKRIVDLWCNCIHHSWHARVRSAPRIILVFGVPHLCRFAPAVFLYRRAMCYTNTKVVKRKSSIQSLLQRKNHQGAPQSKASDFHIFVSSFFSMSFGTTLLVNIFGDSTTTTTTKLEMKIVWY